MGNIVLFGSLTWAMRAQKILEQHGARSAIKKIAHNPKLGGCGYGLELSGSLPEALHTLRAHKIPIIDIL